MRPHRYGLKSVQATVAILGATLALVFLLSLLADPQIQAAPLSEGTSDDPRIQTITVTASLPVYDTHPGNGIDKTIYFNNAVPGVISLTLGISGTPMLTLTAGAAFDDAAQTFTSPETPWSRVVTYNVETGGGDYPGVAYTVINTDSLQSIVVITYVRDITAPEALVLLSPADGEATNDNTLAFAWEAATDSEGAGVAGYNIQIDSRVYTVTAPTTEYTPSALMDESYTWTVRAYDSVENYGDYVATRTLIVDTQAPNIPSLISPADSATINDDTPIFEWATATDNGLAGVAGYNIQVNTNIYTVAAPTTAYTSSVLSDGNYTWTVRAYDSAGNYGDYATPRTLTVDTLSYIYLPLVVRNYRLFSNGDFENGPSGWDTGRGPFSGHGSGIPPGVTFYEGSHRALLGELGASNGSIHVGYGYIAQTFTVDKLRLQLDYRVVSRDIVENNQRYYDTFEVSVNKRPEKVLDAERNSRGCASTVLNPTGVLTVTNAGLAFCAGRSGTSSDVGNKWDSGWKTVTLDLSAFQGENATLYLTIWSREYDSPYYNDRGWYNTWAYVDNLSPQE